MASLYDLELQESNNFIHALMNNGETPAYKLMLDQKKQAEGMGEVGKQLLAQFEDPNNPASKSLWRLSELKDDIKRYMDQVGMSPELATGANNIFASNPESLNNLPEEEQKVITDFWIKKKSIIVMLLNKGYTHEELFS